MNIKNKIPTYFISHGGGPWPWLKNEMPFYDKLEASLVDIPRQIGIVPKAVLVISGHWEENEFSIMAAQNPSMIYDYGGFPEHTYHIKYNAPGSPDLALRIKELIQASGIIAQLDSKRGFDHGTFAPLFAIYPKADIPIIQLSLKIGYDPLAHFKLGQALKPLREEGILIIGSGLSYHNLQNFGRNELAKTASKQFDDWLQIILTQLNPDDRMKKLIDWVHAPSARLAHPQEDHLLPLMVAVGAASDEIGVTIYHEENFFGNITVSNFRFG